MIPYLHSEFCPYLRKTASQQICSIISEKFYYVCLEQCVLGSAHQTPHRFISPESALKFMPHKSRRVSLNTFFPEANCPTKKQMSRIIPSVGHYFLTLGSCVSISSPVKACERTSCIFVCEPRLFLFANAWRSLSPRKRGVAGIILQLKEK